jgi:hypothetical protein
VKRCIVLHLRRCSKATKLCVLAILNAALAIVINNGERLAIHCTWASLASGKIEDQGLLAEFGVALGEVQHGGVV